MDGIVISPRYQMKLAKQVSDALWEAYPTYREVSFYIKKWHQTDENWDWQNFEITVKPSKDIDLLQTLHNMPGELLLKIAIEMGVETPDYIPSIPTFKNELKSLGKTPYETFSKAIKQVEDDPSVAIGLCNSTLESLIKTLLQAPNIQVKLSGKETLYQLAIIIVKEYKLADDQQPKEIKTIGTSLMTICQAIETLRSTKTNFHGKTDDDLLITDSIYAHFIINSVATIGLFLQGISKTHNITTVYDEDDELPF